MYIIRNKKTKQIIHTNVLPVDEFVKEEDIYPDFDPKTMEILKSHNPVLPEHFKVNAEGFIVELTLQEKYDAGFLSLDPTKKVENNEVVTKSADEMAAEGILFTINPFEKLSMVLIE